MVNILYNVHMTYYRIVHLYNFIYFFKDVIYFFLDRGNGVRKGGRETSMCCSLSCAPYWGPNLQPKHVPCLGIEPVTLGIPGQHPIHVATSARAETFIILLTNCIFFLLLLYLS